MEKSCLKIHFHFLQFTKKTQKVIFWSRIHFFVNVARFARKHFLAYPKLVWTPSTYAFRDVIFEHAWNYLDELISTCSVSVIRNLAFQTCCKLDNLWFSNGPILLFKNSHYIPNFRDFCPPKADEFPSKHRSILREQKLMKKAKFQMRHFGGFINSP